MLQILVESGPRARPAAHRLLLSVGLHGLGIGAAIVLSRQPATLSKPQPPLVFFTPQLPTATPTAPRHRAAHPTTPSPPLEALPDLPVVIAPVLPTTVPGVADLLHDMVSPPKSGPALSAAPAGGTSLIATAEPWAANSVDDPVEVIEQPPVPYPPALARAGITGRVELEYVVDTLGRAEPRSLRVVAVTRPEFEAVARATVLGSRFRPARLHGQGVRQLVRQTLSFRSAR